MPYEYHPFDFSLSQEEERHADKLHNESLIIDTLYEGPIGPESITPLLSDKISQHDSARNANIEGLLQLRSIPIREAIYNGNQDAKEQWLRSGLTGGNREIELSSYELFSELNSLAQAQFDHFDWMVKAIKAQDFRRAKQDGKFAGYISTQLVSGAFPDLHILQLAWESGLRMVQLTYNSETIIGCGCTARANSGVTGYGEQAIKLMNDLGIIVDTGHCGEQTTLDACEISNQPVVASHTAAAVVNKHDRCKSDRELEAIATTGGIIGIVTVPFFLKNTQFVTINDFLDHIDYIAKLVGTEYIAIGTDWPNQLPKNILSTLFQDAVKKVGFLENHKVDPLACIDGFQDYADYKNITRGLVSRGYSDDQIKGILGENFLKVFETICG